MQSSLETRFPNLRRSLMLILFAGYFFMGLLVMEQGRTIAHQRALIQDLFSDSVELTALKMKEARNRAR